jgi:perosamine synthetase
VLKGGEMTNFNMSDRGIASYRQAAASNFDFFKRTTLLDDLYAKSLRLPAERGFLLPVCALHVDDEPLIADLTNWRNADVSAYPSQFIATPASTRA